MAKQSLQKTKAALQLVFEQQGELLTNSVIVAEQLEAVHKDFLRVINKYLLDKVGERWADQPIVKIGTQVFIRSSYKTAKGNEYPMWLMNESAFSKIMTLTQRYRKADEIVDKLIDEFATLKSLIQQRSNAAWLEARAKGKIDRRLETDAIRDFIAYAKSQGSQNADKYYLAISKMENQALFLVLGKYPNLRDALDMANLATVQMADRIVARALKEGMNRALSYKEIYRLAKERVEDYAALVGKATIPTSIAPVAQIGLLGNRR